MALEGEIDRDGGTVETDCPACKKANATMKRKLYATVELTCQNCGKKWAAPDLEVAQAQTPDRCFVI